MMLIAKPTSISAQHAFYALPLLTNKDNGEIVRVSLTNLARAGGFVYALVFDCSRGEHVLGRLVETRRYYHGKPV